MRYTFGATLILDPVRLRRLDREREAEEYRNQYNHHYDPFRDMGDMMSLRVEVESPRNLTDEEQIAFEKAFNRALSHFRYYVDEEFSRIKSKS